MGINWGDLMYPNNPNRREEVTKLAHSIRTSVIEIYSNVRTVSISLNQAYYKFQVLPQLDLNITFKHSFDLIQNVMDQWKSVTEELKMDPEVPQKIKGLMVKFEEVTSVGQLPNTVDEILSDPCFDGVSVGCSIVGLVAGMVVSYFIHLSMESLVATSVATITFAGIAGRLIGGGIAILATLIIGAIDGVIEGAAERDKLEQLIKQYKQMDDNLSENLSTLEHDVAAVQRAIIKALPDDA